MINGNSVKCLALSFLEKNQPNRETFTKQSSRQHSKTCVCVAWSIRTAHFSYVNYKLLAEPLAWRWIQKHCHVMRSAGSGRLCASLPNSWAAPLPSIWNCGSQGKTLGRELSSQYLKPKLWSTVDQLSLSSLHSKLSREGGKKRLCILLYSFCTKKFINRACSSPASDYRSSQPKEAASLIG